MATAAAAVVAAARRRVISHFMSRNAVSAKDAVPFAPERRVQRRQFERLLDSGVLAEAKPGHYWLNIPALDQWRERARKRIGLGIGLSVAVAAVAALFAG